MIQWLSALKLTGTQWLGVAAAAVIGVLALKLHAQGRRLHQAQLGILEAQTKTQDGQAAVDSAAAVARFEAAKDAYRKAGGVL